MEGKKKTSLIEAWSGLDVSSYKSLKSSVKDVQVFAQLSSFSMPTVNG